MRLIMPVFIDDITIASTSRAESDRVVHESSKHFKLRDLGWSHLVLSGYAHCQRPC